MALKDMVRKVDGSGNGRTIFLIGRTGMGKTFQVRSLLDGDEKAGLKPLKVLFVSTESKLTTIDDLLKSGKIEPVTIWNEDSASPAYDYPDPTDPGSYQAALMTPHHNLYKVLRGLRTEDHDYDVLYIDSLMRWMLKLIWFIGATNTNPDGRSDYAIFKRKGLNALDTLASVTDATQTKRPVHVVATSGLEMELDAVTGAKKQMAAIDGTKISQMIGHYFDDVFMLQTRPATKKVDGVDMPSTEYLFKTVANSEYDAKVSSATVVLPETIPTPNLRRIIAKLKGEI